MRQFVADDCADGAEVDGLVELAVVERRLQNTGGEVDVVLLRIVIGVHGGGVIYHSFLSTGLPIFAICRLNSNVFDRKELPIASPFLISRLE